MTNLCKIVATTLACLMPLNVFALEIDQRLMPTTPKTAPLPNTNYKLTSPSQQYQPQAIIPSSPDFKENQKPRINHETWCSQRYQSYQRGNNTYALPTGERVPCVSP